jgi:putative membrane protein insertion efficiency factor
MKFIRTVVSLPIIIVVKMYQYVISPLFPATCRYTPTCSNYMIEAVKIWGPFYGFYLGIKRVASCHPWGGHGHDPVPQRKNNK